MLFWAGICDLKNDFWSARSTVTAAAFHFYLTAANVLPLHDLRALWDTVGVWWAFFTVPNLGVAKGVAGCDVPFFDILEAHAGKVSRSWTVSVV
jgi:hypothetical protein